MIRATSIQLMADSADVLAYLFQLDSTQWICLRSPSAAANRGWLECWSSKGDNDPDMASVLEAVRVIVADKLMHGPLGPYISGAHFIPGWNTWGGAIPGPIAQLRPAEVAGNSDVLIGLDEYLSLLRSSASE
jgi:hypothetical protein